MKLNWEWRIKNDKWMGRFGGGWNWILSLQVGGSTILLHLLIATLRIQFKPRIRPVRKPAMKEQA